MRVAQVRTAVLAGVAICLIIPSLSAEERPAASTQMVRRSAIARGRMVPDQLIVKYAASVEGCVACRLASRQSMQMSAGATTLATGLDQLHRRYARGARPVFRHHERVHVSAQAASHTHPHADPAGLDQVYVLDLQPGTDVEEAARAFRRERAVVYAQPNYAMTAWHAPDDPYFDSSGSWGQAYGDLWGLKRMNMALAWEAVDHRSGDGVIVAVVDTGVDYTHPDIAANMWTNPDEVPGNGIDDDGNGFVDDVRGWNFAASSADPMDDNGHGTHVAGTIAAVGYNGIGVIGIAPNARIMPVKALNAEGGGSIASLAAGVLYAASKGAKVINNSWGCTDGCPDNPIIEDAVRMAHQAGALCVFASGNASRALENDSPQNMLSPKPLVVTAVDHADVGTTFSNTGLPFADVAAPGGESGARCSTDALNSILSLRAKNTDPYASACPGWAGKMIVGGQYYRARGTSMAAPHAAGLAALVWANQPQLTNDQVRAILRATTDDIGPSGPDAFGTGRLNALKAVQQVGPPANQAPLVWAGADRRVAVGTVASLAGRVGDDAGTPTVTWSKVSGPGTVTFTASAQAETSATFSAAGDYVLQLRASDGQLTATDDVAVRVYAPPPTVTAPPNQGGWPKAIAAGKFYPSALTVTDLDGDGRRQEVLVVGGDEPPPGGAGLVKVWAYDDTGRLLAGWPQQGRGVPGLHPVIADIDGDHKQEIFLGALALHADGTPITGWPKLLDGCVEQGQTVPLQVSAIADLDRDGTVEILGMLADGATVAGNAACSVGTRVYAWTPTGQLRPGFPVSVPDASTVGAQHLTFLAVADLDGDGKLEIVAVAGTDGGPKRLDRVYAWHHDGTPVTGWPQDIPNLSSKGAVNDPTIADLNGDGRDEVILVADDAEDRVHVLQGDGRPLAGWPVTLADGAVFKDTWPAAVAGDVTGDGRPELVVLRANNDAGQAAMQLVVLRADGTALPGFPKTLDGFGIRSWVSGTGLRMHGSQLPLPAIADLNGDGHADIVLVGIPDVGQLQIPQPYVWAWGGDGQLLSGFPFKLPATADVSSVAIADVDGDGDGELGVVAHAFPILPTLTAYVLDLPGRAGPMEWPLYGHDARRTFRHVSAASGNRPPVLAPIGAKTVAVGQELRFTVDFDDDDVTNTKVSVQGLPTGASFDAAPRVFAWTPTAQQVGEHRVTFTVTDAGGLTDDELVVITVTAAPTAPVLRILEPAPDARLSGSTVAVRYEAVGDHTGVDHVHLQLDDQPEVRDLDFDGRYEFTSVAAGAHVLKGYLAAADHSRIGEIAQVSFTVEESGPPPSPENRPPVLAPIGSKQVEVGQRLTFTVSASDPGEDPVRLSAAPLPASATFDPSTGRFEWQPTAADVGVHYVTFTASDGRLTDEETVAVTVVATQMPPEPEPTPPPAANRPPTVDAGADQRIRPNESAQLAGRATDDGLPNPPGQLTARWTLRRGPGTAYLDNSSQLATRVSFSAPGEYRFRLTVSDGELSAADEVVVTVARRRERRLRLFFQVVPQRVHGGDESFLLWRAPGADACEASGGWSGSKPPFGIQRVRPTATTTYRLRCTNGDDEVEESVTVRVSPRPRPRRR